MSTKLTRRRFTGSLLLAAAMPAALRAAPTVFPTGTTIYDPERAWNGFTVLSSLDTQAVLVIDMNGRVVKRWDGFNVSAGGPGRILPQGALIAPTGAFPGHQESTALKAVDFGGAELWRFDHAEEIEIEGVKQWSARQHHDWQRSDYPAGYYSPQFTPSPVGGKTLVLTHSSSRRYPEIAGAAIQDDRLIELDGDGKITWDWRAADHVDEFGFDAAARAAIDRTATLGPPNPGTTPPAGTARRAHEGYDWLHVNAAAYVGPNQWFDAGDTRFDPANVIISSRNSSFIAIIARDGSVAWQIGPDYSKSPALAAIGQVIGQHNPHLIPPGLPGAGNLLVFDNGGSSGYGAPSPISPLGNLIYQRALSRVLEINPVTLELVWSYTGPTFFSTNISGAQRLPNGNTQITEGAPGRVFEVTPDKQIVWEYMNPPGESVRRGNAVYRAYRVPYGWLPQLAEPRQVAIARPEPGTFHVPGTPQG